MMINNSIRTVLAIILSVVASTVMADKSDYIWNQQFEQKLELAKQGDAKAQYDIGKMYQKGQGTKSNPEEAFNWFNKAAEQGHVRAVYKVGYLYHKGEGVAKDNNKAFNWIKKAADDDYAPAMFYLGQLYASGAGTGKDLDQALRWYEKAESQGYHPAKAAVAATRSKLAEARAQAKAQAAPPPPPSRPVVSRTQAAPPKAAASASSSSGSGNVLAALISSKWKRDGKPAAELPSAATECSVSDNQISCNSQEVESREKFGTVTYKVESVIGNFSGQEFSAQYRRNVTLIFPDDVDNPDVKIPLDYGPQPPQLMRCKMNASKVTCTTQDNQVLSYNK